MSRDKAYGIPTEYRGYIFRSRLEAKWAAFFDLLGWRYEYESCDFDGWIPDFVIFGAKPIYVEVKPVSDFPEDVAAKIDASGCEDETLIVGLTLIQENTSYSPSLYIGWLNENDTEQGWGMGWGLAPLGRWIGNDSAKKGDGRIGFCHYEGSYHDRITGAYDGGSHGQPISNEEVVELWHKAANIVQWQPKAKR